MSGWRLTLLAAAAAVALQACDVSIRPQAAGQESGPVGEAPAAPAATAPETTVAAEAPAAATAAVTPPAADAAAQPAPMTADNSAAPAGATMSTDSSASAPAGPAAALPSDTTAMGAQPGPAAAALPLPAAGDGTAAPTELSRFFEASEAAAAKKAEVPKADARPVAKKGAKS